MKRRGQYFFAVLMILLLLPAVPGTVAAGGTQAQGTDPNAKAPMTIEYFKADLAGVDTEKIPFLKAIKEKFNITLELSGGSMNDYQSQLNLRVAAGDTPDIMLGIGAAYFTDLALRDIFLDLTPYKPQLGELKNYVGDSWDSVVINGKLYGLSGIPGQSEKYFTYWIRSDWIKKLNLPMPKNYNELFDIAQAFTSKDPDGNGRNDTYGFTGVGLSTFCPVFGSYGVPLAYYGQPKGEFFIENGGLKNSLYAQGMPEALRFISRMITSGVVEPDILINDMATTKRIAFQGQAGIIFMDWANMRKNEFVAEWKAVNPNAEWVQLAALQGSYGKSNQVWDVSTSATTGLALARKLSRDTQKLNRIIEMLNFAASREGSRLILFGEEGRHYTIQDGTVVATDLAVQEGANWYLFQLFSRDDSVYLPARFFPQREYVNFALNDSFTEVYTNAVIPPEGFNAADANRFIYEELVKFAYGRRPIGEYNTFLSQLENTFGYKKYLDAAEKKLAEMGIVK